MTIRSFESLMSTYQITRRHMPEDSNPHSRLSAIPKSHKFELSLKLAFKFMFDVLSVLIIVSNRCNSADFKIQDVHFIVSLSTAAVTGCPGGCGLSMRR